MTGTAVVTGAAGVVGGAIAARLARDGFRVVRTDRVGDVDVLADVVDSAGVEQVAAFAEAGGAVEVLVNAAGAYGPRAPFVATDPDQWWRVIETNLRGPAAMCRRLVPAMVDRGRGYVVNINSRAAVWDDPQASSVAYSVSKAALTRFTEALAAELDGTGVVALDVSPGFVRSGMTATRPGIDDVPAGAFVAPEVAAETVAVLVRGAHDALHGHFVHALDDLDALAAHVAQHPGARRLSLSPCDSADPLA